MIGVPTFGKGLVQTLFPLSDGSGLAVTTQIYLTAGGREITPNSPIKPDVEVQALTPEELEKIKNEQAKRGGPTGPVTAEDLLRIDPALDPQLRRALEILKDQIESSKTRRNAAYPSGHLPGASWAYSHSPRCSSSGRDAHCIFSRAPFSDGKAVDHKIIITLARTMIAGRRIGAEFGKPCSCSLSVHRPHGSGLSVGGCLAPQYWTRV